MAGKMTVEKAKEIIRLWNSGDERLPGKLFCEGFLEGHAAGRTEINPDCQGTHILPQYEEERKADKAAIEALVKALRIIIKEAISLGKKRLK